MGIIATGPISPDLMNMGICCFQLALYVIYESLLYILGDTIKFYHIDSLCKLIIGVTLKRLRLQRLNPLHQPHWVPWQPLSD